MEAFRPSLQQLKVLVQGSAGLKPQHRWNPATAELADFDFCHVGTSLSNLLGEGAAVLLRYALPHGLLDRLDLLPQGDARRSRGFDHLPVHGLLFSDLSRDRGQKQT